MIFYDNFGFVIKIFVIEVDISSSEPFPTFHTFFSCVALVMHGITHILLPSWGRESPRGIGAAVPGLRSRWALP